MPYVSVVAKPLDLCRILQTDFARAPEMSVSLQCQRRVVDVFTQRTVLKKAAAERDGARLLLLLLRLRSLLVRSENALLQALFATLLLATAHLPAMLALGFELLGDRALSLALSFLLVHCFHEGALVLKLVSFRLHVELVVHVFVNLLAVTVPTEQASQHTHPADPKELLWHA